MIETRLQSVGRCLFFPFFLACLVAFPTGTCSASPKKPGIPRHIKDGFNTVEYRRQFATIDKLVAMGPRYIPALVTMLKDRASRFRFCAIHALAKYGKTAFPALKNALKSKHRLVKVGAVKALGLMGRKARPLVSSVLRCLGSKDPTMQFEASRAIARIGLSESQKIEFIALFRSRDPRTLRSLCRVIERRDLGLAPRVDGYLAKILEKRQDPILRVAAARALAARKASPLIRKALIAGLRDKERSVRLEVARALILLAEQNAKFMEPLQRHYQKCSKDEKLGVAKLLSEGGNARMGLTAAIVKKEKELSVVVEAVSSLSIGGPKAEKLIERALQHSSEEIQRRALFVAAVGGERGRLFCPLVLSILGSNPSDELQQCCFWFFGQVNAKAPEIRSKLIKAAGFGPLPLRMAAMEALERLGEAEAELIEVLKRAMNENDIPLRERAKSCLEAVRKK